MDQWQRPGGDSSTTIIEINSGDTIYFPIAFTTRTSQILAIDWESNENHVRTLAINTLYLNRFIIRAKVEDPPNSTINQCGVIAIGW